MNVAVFVEITTLTFSHWGKSFKKNEQIIPLKAEFISREQIKYFISTLQKLEYDAHWHITAKPPKPPIPAIMGRVSPDDTAFLHPVVTSPTDFIMYEIE